MKKDKDTETRNRSGTVREKVGEGAIRKMGTKPKLVEKKDKERRDKEK